MGISVEDFLYRYFRPDELKDVLVDIGIPVGRTKKERVERILDNWRSHNRDWYELLDYLDWDVLSQICDDFNIGYSDYNTEDSLRNKIGDEWVLIFSKRQKKNIEKKSEEKSSTFNVLGKNITIGSDNIIHSSEASKGSSISKAQLAVAIIVGAFVITGVVWGITSSENSPEINSEKIPESIDVEESSEIISSENLYTIQTHLPQNKDDKYGLIIEFGVNNEEIPGAHILIEFSSEVVFKRQWSWIPDQKIIKTAGEVFIFEGEPIQRTPTTFEANFYTPKISSVESYYLYFESDQPVEAQVSFEEYDPTLDL